MSKWQIDRVPNQQEFYERHVRARLVEAEKEIDRNQCLPGRLMPAHVSAMVMFLAADDGAMCTAQEFIVDAGWC